jgi:hypothetical protein
MIKIVKLITGEELIADVTGGDITITLNKPCVLQVVPSRQNPDQPMMGMFPYAPYTEDHSIDVDVDKIVWDAKPVKELYNQYNSAFGSGIQLAGL